MSEITYTMQKDYLIPDLALPPQPEVPLGKFAHLRREFLENHRRVTFVNLLTSGKLTEHLYQIEREAMSRFGRLTKQLAQEQGVTEALQAQLSAVSSVEASALENEKRKLRKRLDELDRLFSALYEDKVMERITQRNYEHTSRNYEEEQRSIESRLYEIDEALIRKRENDAGIQRFAETIRGYDGITELTAPVVNALIDKITVSERHVNDSGKTEQRIRIYYKFIGALDEPAVITAADRYSFPVVKTCLRCGSSFTAESNSAKYCPSCRPAVRKEQQRKTDEKRKHERRERRLLHGTPGYKERKCNCCGGTYKPNSGNSSYCPVCQALTPSQRKKKKEKPL